ncbi:MAG: hypothetical protein QOF01_4676 [Thermomicrobiales bacterium]|jgi:hypothetical protein|nr:hypothetical protein [Thermomicrobiales bacterium]MEA2522811.1 hypothetical protein [Thermomicrobiales bacterium]MEA2598207.1 hypothetical protein [Thermomicrobiales bacterium]
MTPPPSPETANAQEAGVVEDAIDLVASRDSEGHGFQFKVRASGRVYRLDSARDPHLPRFWCFRICRCTSAGTVDPRERPWYGGDRMTREELPAAVAAIRAGPTEWLALPEHAELRRWVLEDAPIEAIRPGLTPGPARRAKAE